VVAPAFVGLDLEYVVVAVIGEELTQPHAVAVLVGSEMASDLMEEEMSREIQPGLKSLSIHSLSYSTSFLETLPRG
jgi:hypothetical protein